jgi:hypothetical protein
MAIVTYEATVEDGQIKLAGGVRLPERSRVYVVVPDAPERRPRVRVNRPRLAHPEQASDFVKEILRDDTDARLPG